MLLVLQIKSKYENRYTYSMCSNHYIVLYVLTFLLLFFSPVTEFFLLQYIGSVAHCSITSWPTQKPFYQYAQVATTLLEQLAKKFQSKDQSIKFKNTLHLFCYICSDVGFLLQSILYVQNQLYLLYFITRSRYRQHNLYVQSRCPPEQLLVFNTKEGWEPLCKFLEKPVPSVPFPKQNVKSDIFRQVAFGEHKYDMGYIRRVKYQAFFRVLLFSTALAIVLGCLFCQRSVVSA